MKAARAIVDVIESPDPPGLLVLGQDAVGAFRDVLDAQRAELDAWEHIGLGTGFDA